MSLMQNFFLSLGTLLAGSLLPFAAGRCNRIAHGIGLSTSILGAAFGIIAAFMGLASGKTEQFHFFWMSAELPLTLVLDGLSSFFLLPVLVMVIICSVYASRSLKFQTRSFQAARHWSAFNILAASMAMVTAAADSLTFLIAWEMMSLSSFLLVVHDYRNEPGRRAGLIYLIATHLGTAFLFLLFLEAYRRTGSLDFSAMEILRNLPPGVGILFFFLALAGFGTKAGLFPLHIWLPEAHSAAPSHVSALMSGVMIKTAIYAFLRIVTFLPALPSWCGLLVAALGITGALFGIALASLQTDMKRSLACSTIENIGIIFLAIGLWLYCTGTGYLIAAHLALGGALLHIWNHALFKSLLFLGAGSVYHATGTREMSALGGLMRRLPFTGSLTVFGAAAIAALPPLNGFISELLIFLGLFYAGQAASGGQVFLFMIFALLLAMVGGMVALAMTRFIGIVFSGEPRSRKSADARESFSPITVAMLFSALGCLVVGVFPQTFLAILDTPIRVLARWAPPPLQTVVPLPFGPAWSISALVLGGGLVAVLLVIQLRQRRQSGTTPTWGCGFSRPTARMSYSAGSYGQLAQDEMYCACLRPILPPGGRSPLFPPARRFQATMGDPVLDRGFSPVMKKCADIAYSFRVLQAGRLNVYLAYIFLATILMLGWNYLAA